jgi:hypothetical protein
MTMSRSAPTTPTHSPENLNAIQGPIAVNGVSLGSPAHSLLAVCGQTSRTVTTNGGDSVRVFDTLGSQNTYTVTASTVSRPGAAAISFSNIGWLQVAGSYGANYAVQTTPAGARTQLSGTPNPETTNVTSTGQGSILEVYGDDGNDQVVIHNTGQGSGVLVNGGYGNDQIGLENTSANSAIKLIGEGDDDTLYAQATAAGTVAQLDAGDSPHDSNLVNPGQQGTLCTGPQNPPTPVQLLHFSATRKGPNSALIRWASAGEATISGYRLYRQDQQQRLLVARRLGHGSVQGHAYRVLDRHSSAVARYLLDVIGTDGSRRRYGPIRSTR